MHRSCRCANIPIPPGGTSRPFVDFMQEIRNLDPAQQARVMGKANWQLVESGAVKFEDVVTRTRVRTLQEVVSTKKLTVAAMTKAGVSRVAAERAAAAVNTPAHLTAAADRRAIVASLEARGIAQDQIKAAVAERLAARAMLGSIATGPTTPTTPTTPGPAGVLARIFAYLGIAAARAFEALGLKPPAEPGA